MRILEVIVEVDEGLVYNGRGLGVDVAGQPLVCQHELLKVQVHHLSQCLYNGGPPRFRPRMICMATDRARYAHSARPGRLLVDTACEPAGCVCRRTFTHVHEIVKKKACPPPQRTRDSVPNKVRVLFRWTYEDMRNAFNQPCDWFHSGLQCHGRQVGRGQQTQRGLQVYICSIPNHLELRVVQCTQTCPCT